MNDWTIRRAEPGDADGLGSCLDAAYADHAAGLDDLPSMSEDCAGQIEKHDVWVAEAGNVIVGGLVLIPAQGYMLLANVAVHPDHRGMGLGQQLLALAETETRRRGFAEMRLNTHAGMPEAIGLYARSGWSHEGRSGNKVAMRKVLRR